MNGQHTKETNMRYLLAVTFAGGPGVPSMTEDRPVRTDGPFAEVKE
jgi:hypothetical protein